MIRLHNQNRTHTFIDVESGSFISLPKDLTDKPPVNADVNGLQFFGKTTQDGEPAFDNPVDTVNIPPEFNLTSCGRNLFTTASFRQVFTTPYNTYTTIIDKNNFKTSKNFSGQHQTHGFVISVLPNTDYTVSFDLSYEKLVDVTTTIIALQIFLYDISNNVLINDLDWYKAFIIKKLNENESRQVFSFTTPGSCTKIAIVPNNLLSFEGGNYHHRINVVYQNVSVIRATEILQPYEPYIGSTYPYRLEDLDGNLHELCSLPDGTCDEYDVDNGVLIKRVKRLTVTSGTTSEPINLQAYYWTASADSTYFNIFWSDNTVGWQSELGTSYNVRCNIASSGSGDFRCSLNLRTNNTGIQIRYPKDWFISRGYTLDDDGVRQYINDIINANGPIVFDYPYSEPQIIPIKRYGETYDGQVWDKNEKPKSIQYHTNIFTDVGAEMQCEVRKLGNRAMGTFNWVTETGDKITTEDGDYIMLEY